MLMEEETERQRSCVVFVFVSCVVLCCGCVAVVLCCGVLCCVVLSCLALSCLVLSCLVLSCLVLSCLVLSCLVLSCLVLCTTRVRTVAQIAIVELTEKIRQGLGARV